MKITILVMEKNEQELLPIWAGFHRQLAGAENLIVHDNGSDAGMEPVLAGIAAGGVRVIREFHRQSDFENKGTILADRIRQLDADNPSDFYFPLDCDEFLGVRLADGSISFRPEDIRAGLEPFRDCPDTLRICCAYDNVPGQPGRFHAVPSRRKVFFARNACAWMNLGYHNGRSKTSAELIETPIVYVHLHFKPFAVQQAHARQKLAGRVADFEPATLREHLEKKRPGHHLIKELLISSESEYLRFYKKKFSDDVVELPAFGEQLSAYGLRYPYSA